MTKFRLFFEVFNNTNGRNFSENSYSRITRRALTKVPVAIIPWNFYFFLLVHFLINFCLVDANKIWPVVLNQIIHGILTQDTSDSIYIPHCQTQSLRSFTTAKYLFRRRFTFFHCCRTFSFKFFRAGLFQRRRRIVSFHQFVNSKNAASIRTMFIFMRKDTNKNGKDKDRNQWKILIFQITIFFFLNFMI